MTLTSKDNSVGILQAEVGFTSSSSDRPILGSHWITTCLVVIVFNPATKKTAFAHFDELCDYQPTIQKIQEKLTETHDDKLEVHLITLNINTNNIYSGLKKAIPQNWKVIQEINSTSVAFDSRSNIVLYPVNRENLGQLNIPFKERNKSRTERLVSNSENKKNVYVIYNGIDNPYSKQIDPEYQTHSNNPQAFFSKKAPSHTEEQVFSQKMSCNII